MSRLLETLFFNNPSSSFRPQNQHNLASFSFFLLTHLSSSQTYPHRLTSKTSLLLTKSSGPSPSLPPLQKKVPAPPKKSTPRFPPSSMTAISETNLHTPPWAGFSAETRLRTNFVQSPQREHTRKQHGWRSHLGQDREQKYCGRRCTVEPVHREKKKKTRCHLNNNVSHPAGGACAQRHNPRGGPLTRIKSQPLLSLSRLLCSALVFALAFAFSSAVVLALFPCFTGIISTTSSYDIRSTSPSSYWIKYAMSSMRTSYCFSRTLPEAPPPHSHASSNPAHPKEAVTSHRPSRYSPRRIRHSSPRRFGTLPRFPRSGWSAPPRRCWFD